MIFILSVSAVSAELMDDGDSFALANNDGLIDLNDNLSLSNNLSDDLDDNLNEDSDSDDTGSDVPSFGDESVDTGSGVPSSGDGSGESGADDGSDDTPDDGENEGTNNGTDNGTDNSTDNENLKNTTLKIVSKNDWKIYGVGNYIVKLLDEDKNPVSHALIKFKIKTPKGKYMEKTSYTDDEGQAVLNLNLTIRGIYNISVSYGGDLDYNPAKSVSSNVILYEKTKIKTPKNYSYRSSNFTIKFVTSFGDVANKKLIIYIDGVKYVKTTDSKGQVYVKMPSNKRSVNLNCTFNGMDYLLSYNYTMKLPVYKKTYTKALVFAILKGKNFKVLLKGIDGKILKNEKVNITIDGKTYIRKTNNKGIAYLKVKLARNAYKVSVSYDNNGVYGPSKNSSTLNVIDPSGQFKRGLNQNTKLSVARYLHGGGHARITKSIRRLSKKLTSKYSTKLEKATAIFNYVRDNLGYSYYANSRKGAAKTLRTKKGNCCDHSNLIVALCRASKIPARYSHARGCKFKSGLVTGHVWAQIYVNGRWYSADGTSYKNSLGHINNWNTKSYHSYHRYRNIPF